MNQNPYFSTSSSPKWHAELSSKLAQSPFRELEQLFGLCSWPQWPNAEGLNLIRAQHVQCSDLIPKFVCQSQLPEQQSYYEQIIYQQGVIPTRSNSWHDLFNGLIWCLFPNTKLKLNQQHVDDIQQFGLSPRTPRRNHITHFDECGVVMACSEPKLLDMLTNHQWQDVFITYRHLWGREIQGFVFGHANYEMLLNPFIGLTGKWLAVKVDDSFWQSSLADQYTMLDTQLAARVGAGIFNSQNPLLPLPLLGIPGWYEDNQQHSFYANKDYFRDKSVRSKIT